MAFSVVQICLFLLFGSVLKATFGTKEGICTVRRTRNGDRIRSKSVQTSDLCADNNFCSKFYNAVPLSGTCTCACAPVNSTFSESLGSCVPNIAIRKGCTLYFTGENELSPLRLFINTSSASLKFGKQNLRDCSIDKKSSYYFNKSGWESLNSDPVGFPFKIEQTEEAKKTVQSLKWSGQPKSSLFGRLIKLGVNCKLKNGKPRRSCLVFKVQGTIQAPCIVPTIKPPVISSQPSTSGSTVSDSGRTTRGPTVREPTSEGTSSISAPTGLTDPHTGRTSTSAPTGLSDPHTGGTPLPVSVIIAVAVAITAVAVACTVGFIVLFCRRKKKHHKRDSTGNPTYQSADDAILPLHQLTDEPVYATVSSPTHAPLYQPLTLERTAKDYQLLVKQSPGDSSSYLEPVENTTKHLNPKVYDYACPETVIEGDSMPESARYASADDLGFTINGQPSPRDPASPFYNVLEEGRPKSPIDFTFNDSSEVSRPDNTSSSSRRNPVSPSEESQEYDPDNPPCSPETTYLELLPDCVA